MKKVLTVAGSDCSGGAGIQADLKTMSALGVYGMSVICSVVAENTSRVIAMQNICTDIVAKQMDAVFEDIGTDAVKIGMLSSGDNMEVVAEKLEQYKPGNIVLDPVMYAKGGAALMDLNAMDVLIRKVLPKADLITPNLPEAEKLCGFSIASREDMKRAAKAIYALGCGGVLVKGGHLEGDAVDILYDGVGYSSFSVPRIDTQNTHGTGCTYSSCIASFLALGYDVRQAVSQAKRYVTGAIRHALAIGHGHGPTNHFFDLYRRAGVQTDDEI